ncbi:translation initiation factor 2 [Streptomyces lusitanus]|uniref:Translation initiation factor 2 n=1 Tax=Streptomyces lusitanus TaxID=68232 RepID=A0ABU3K026_9ACTN|nr:translation initiation factor 2 [Streptomyces lusitanus]
MRDRFTVVGRATDCHLFEGDGVQAIDEDNVHIKYTPERVRFPEEIAGWRRAIEEEEERKEAAGLPHRWNNARFAVERVVVTRTHIAEYPVLSLALRDADYFDFLTTSLNLDRRQKNGLTLREQYLEGNDPVDAPSWMNCSLGVNVALETGRDGKMLFSRRSAQVAGPNSGRWNSSANEGLAQQHDLPADGSPVSLHAVARRALLEELAVHDGDGTELELLGLGLDVVNHQWAVFFRAVAPDLDEAALRLRWTRGVTDKWEHDRFAFVDADPESVFGFIADEPEARWTPCAPTLFYLALVRGAVRRAGGDPAARFLVEQAEQKVMRERGL